MARLKINYDMVCECVSRLMDASLETDTKNQQYLSLMENSIVGSMNTASKEEFKEHFKDSPDNIETQVEMYSFLLDDVCNRIDRGIQRLEKNKKKAKKITTDLTGGIRKIYAALSFEKITSLNKYAPATLAEDYFGEKFSEKELTNEIIEKTLNSYLSTLKIKEVLDKEGLTNELLTNLEAIFL